MAVLRGHLVLPALSIAAVFSTIIPTTTHGGDAMSFFSMMASDDRNVTEHQLQAGWVTHIEVVAGDCNHGRPPSGQKHPDRCPVDKELLELVEQQQPATRTPFMYTELPDCGGCGKGVWKRVPWCPKARGGKGDYCAPRMLDPRWHANLLAITSAIKPLVDNGQIGAVALGDELVDHGVSFENFTSVANVLRQQLGPNVKLLANDACTPPGPASWPTIPSALDYISCDVYNVTSGRGEAEQIIDYYERFLPKLHDHQQALLVPGTFACSTGIGATENRTTQADMVLEKLQTLEEWAGRKPQIGGFYPWCVAHIHTGTSFHQPLLPDSSLLVLVRL